MNLDPSIFDYKNYKKYLHDAIESFPHHGRGIKIALASAAGCQNTYVSQVLNGNAHFNLEQANNIAHYLKLSKDEHHFFLLLIQHARAASPSLKEYFLEHIEEMIQHRLALVHTRNIDNIISPKNLMVYYSEWYFSAIHMIISIPQFQTMESVAKSFNLPVTLVSKVFDFLVKTGLILKKENKFYPSKNKKVHLRKDSPLVKNQHVNWRLMALQSLNKTDFDDLHYSSIITISEKDSEKVKALLQNTLQSMRTLLKDSHDECVRAITLDFFKI